VHSIANALHYLLYNNSKNSTHSYTLQEVTADSGNLLMKALFSNVRFYGVTNLIEISEGQLINGKGTADEFGRGDRYTGLFYDPINYNAHADEHQNWVDIGHWGSEGDWQLCDEHLLSELVGRLEECPYKVVYNTLDGLRPKDRPPAKILEMNEGMRGLFIALAAIGAIIVVALAAYLAINRSSNLVKASQVRILKSHDRTKTYISSIAILFM